MVLIIGWDQGTYRTYGRNYCSTVTVRLPVLASAWPLPKKISDILSIPFSLILPTSNLFSTSLLQSTIPGSFSLSCLCLFRFDRIVSCSSSATTVEEAPRCIRPYRHSASHSFPVSLRFPLFDFDAATTTTQFLIPSHEFRALSTRHREALPATRLQPLN